MTKNTISSSGFDICYCGELKDNRLRLCWKCHHNLMTPKYIIPKHILPKRKYNKIGEQAIIVRKSDKKVCTAFRIRSTSKYVFNVFETDLTNAIDHNSVVSNLSYYKLRKYYV